MSEEFGDACGSIAGTGSKITCLEDKYDKDGVPEFQTLTGKVLQVSKEAIGKVSSFFSKEEMDLVMDKRGDEKAGSSTGVVSSFRTGCGQPVIVTKDSLKSARSKFDLADNKTPDKPKRLPFKTPFKNPESTLSCNKNSTLCLTIFSMIVKCLMRNEWYILYYLLESK